MPEILSLKGSAQKNNTVESSISQLFFFPLFLNNFFFSLCHMTFLPPSSTLSKGLTLVNATGKSFTVKSSLQFQVDQRDDGVAYTCSVEHVALSNPYTTTEVLEVHCEYSDAAGLQPCD